jgi:hypothetical protein
MKRQTWIYLESNHEQSCFIRNSLDLNPGSVEVLQLSQTSTRIPNAFLACNTSSHFSCCNRHGGMQRYLFDQVSTLSCGRDVEYVPSRMTLSLSVMIQKSCE